MIGAKSHSHDVYGWVVEHGHTEEIIGCWFAQDGGRRDTAEDVINTVRVLQEI